MTKQVLELEKCFWSRTKFKNFGRVIDRFVSASKRRVRDNLEYEDSVWTRKCAQAILRSKISNALVTHSSVRMCKQEHMPPLTVFNIKRSATIPSLDWKSAHSVIQSSKKGHVKWLKGIENTSWDILDNAIVKNQSCTSLMCFRVGYYKVVRS